MRMLVYLALILTLDAYKGHTSCLQEVDLDAKNLTDVFISSSTEKNKHKLIFGRLVMSLFVIDAPQVSSQLNRLQHSEELSSPRAPSALAHSRRGFIGKSLSTALVIPTLASASIVTVPKAMAIASPASVSPIGRASVDPTTEFISGLVAGAAQKTVKEIVLHPLDTVKCRLQVTQSRRSLFDAALYADAYSGIGPAVLSGAPAASVFFAVKDAIKEQARGKFGSTFGTCVAVVGANLPYWLVRNPTEVIKSRRQAGQVGDASAAAAELWREKGIAGFYRGYVSNLAYACPVDAAKFVIYEAIKTEIKSRNGGNKLSPIQAASFGALASSCAQGISTPLDVVRTRIMTLPPDKQAESVFKVLNEIATTEGSGALYAGITPKLARAVVSGALQFSVLEKVKDVVNSALTGRDAS